MCIMLSRVVVFWLMRVESNVEAKRDVRERVKSHNAEQGALLHFSAILSSVAVKAFARLRAHIGPPERQACRR